MIIYKTDKPEKVAELIEYIVKRENDKAIELINELDPEILKTKIDFIDYGPDVNDFTAMLQCCCRGSVVVLKKLYEKIKSFDDIDSENNTCISLLARRLENAQVAKQRNINNYIDTIEEVEEMYKFVKENT